MIDRATPNSPKRPPTGDKYSNSQDTDGVGKNLIQTTMMEKLIGSDKIF